MRLSHSQKLPGCGKRRTKINQVPADEQEAKMKKNSGYQGSVISPTDTMSSDSSYE